MGVTVLHGQINTDRTGAANISIYSYGDWQEHNVPKRS